MEKAEALRKRELNKTLKKLKNLSPEEIEALEVLTRSLVQKLLYFPINFMKSSHHHKGKEAINIVRRMFELDEEITHTNSTFAQIKEKLKDFKKGLLQ